MRKLSLVMVLTIFLQACSMGDIFFLPATITPIPSPTTFITYTPVNTPGPTNTATLFAPTIVRIPTYDPNQPAVPIYTAEGAPSALPFPTPEGPGAGFDSISVSESRIYWGGCKHNYAVITAEVDDPDEVISVVIFTRVKAENEEDYTPWTSGNVMYNNGGGVFSYKMIASEVEGHNHYLRSQVFFQLVATDIKGNEIGRSKIFTDKISMFPCLCLDPTTGCPPTVKPNPTPET